MVRHLSYNRISGRRILVQPSRGFRLKARPRLCVQWLRLRLFYLIRSCSSKWKLALHDHIMKLLMIIKKSGKRRSSVFGKCNITITTKSSTKISSIRSYNRLNSFYSEAISNCLEFIKLSNTSSISTTFHRNQASTTTSLDGKSTY